MPSLQHRPLLLQSHSERPLFRRDLAAARFEPGGLSGQREDVDEVISEETSLPLAGPTRDGIQTLLGPTLTLLHRSKELGELEDINSTIIYLRKLHECPPEASNVPHHAVTTSLVEILAARVKGEAGDTLEDINEILFFYRRLTAGTSPSPGYLSSASQALTRAVLDAYSRGKQSHCLDQAIGCLRDALNVCPPGIRHLSLELSSLLVVRFLTFYIDDDYQEAKTILHNITVPPSPRTPADTYQIQTSASTSAIGLARSIVYSNIEDWEGAVSRCRSFLEYCPSFGNPLHSVIIELLVSHAEQVSKHFSPPHGVQAAHSDVDHLPFSTLGTFGDGPDGPDIVAAAPSMTALGKRIDDLRELYSTARPGTEHQRNCLKDLVRCYNTKISLTDDTTFIEDAIKYNQRLIETTHPTDQSKFLHLSTFGNFLYAAFDRTNEVEYLNNSIARHREVLGLTSAQLTHFSIIRRLIWSLSIRWRLSRCQSDLEEIMDRFASGVRETIATVPSRFELACRWAHAARIYEHHSLPSAYQNAMSLMQSSLVFGPTLPIQHDRLVENSDLYKTPLIFASYLIQKGQLEISVETLERRTLLWSEMRGLRTSTDRLRAVNPVLAEKFTTISQELEILTTSTLSNESLGTGDGGSEGEEWMGRLSGLMERQQELLGERDVLISQIRDLPGLKDFLVPLPFDSLRLAASRGPVIIINHCRWRSDILIVLHDSPPSHVPTPYNFFDRASRLKDDLITTRENYGLDSENYEDALSSVLIGLYELVGRPVIERLKRLGIAEQSRVWWCPTSVFGYLPLHAMGPISSDGGNPRYFSDAYVSSYTPTLSTLIASREPDTQVSALPSLIVAQPSPSLPGAWPDAEVMHDLDLQATSLSPGNTSSTTVLDGLQRHQFACLAYRGKLKTGKPFEAAMWFPNGECLTLLDIVRSRHPAGESVLLPGAQTAELTDGSIPDEALHLSAAVQFSGFRSVIGTMWGVDDEDGQSFAEAVLQSMFSGRVRGEAYYERSARALRHAVQQMRQRGLPLARWVNYVHHGA